MKVDFNKPILDIDGQPALDDKKEVITLKNIAVKALIMDIPSAAGPEVIKPDKKVDNAMLARTIHTSKEPLSLTAEEIVNLKDRIGRLFLPLTVLSAYEILDPKE